MPLATGCPEGLNALADTVQRLARETGFPFALYTPDGRPAVSSDTRPAPSAETPDDDLARLVRQAAEAGDDRLQCVGDWVRAAWAVSRPGRPCWVVAVRLPAADRRQQAESRRTLALAAEAVHARTESADSNHQNDSLAEVLSQTFEEVSLLHNLGEVLRVDRPVTEFLDYACHELCDVTGAESAAAYLPAAAGQDVQTVVQGCLPFDPHELPTLVAHVLDGSGSVSSVIINNHCQDDPDLARLSIALERLILVPVPMRDDLRGAILVCNRRDGEFGSPDAKLIRSVTASGAVFIENRQLYRELRQLMLDLVRALVSSIDAKDPYTCGHSERVAITCREIARRMDVEPEDVERAYLAGLLHDIGKMGVSETILQKAGRLEPEEREAIRQHPVVGNRILNGIKQLEPIRQAVLSHHERLDGSGYPEGLAGDAIPLLARIVGLADAFDAMTSNRPYRPMMPLEHVKREIERNIGSQFDVRAADAFFSINLNRLMTQFADRPTTIAEQFT